MGTIVDDGAMSRRRSGNGGVGSSITGEGQSDSWIKGKKNVRRLVDMFLGSTDERKKLAGSPPTFDTITADQACNHKLYEEFAGFLANEYKCGAGKNKDKHLKVGPAVHYFNSLRSTTSTACGPLLQQPRRTVFCWEFFLFHSLPHVYTR